MSEDNAEVLDIQTRDYEQEARAQGWKPQEEYAGDNWVDAKTFVERGDKYVGILKDRYERLEKKLKYQEQLNGEFKTHIKRQEELHQKELNNLIKRLERERAQAINNGDGAAFDKADQALQDAKKNKEEMEKRPQPQAPAEWVADWLEENDWYQRDRAAAIVADTYAQDLHRANPELQGRAFMDKVTEYVRAQFPHKFENKNKRQAPVVDTQGTPPSSGGDAPSQKGAYRTLPKEAKDTFNRFVREGIYKDTDEARQRYASMYFEE